MENAASNSFAFRPRVMNHVGLAAKAGAEAGAALQFPLEPRTFK
jgi:hypothetical protein